MTRGDNTQSSGSGAGTGSGSGSSSGAGTGTGNGGSGTGPKTGMLPVLALRRTSKTTAVAVLAIILIADSLWGNESCDAQRTRQVQIIPSRAPHLATPAARP